jgi:hypothetical protein
MKTNYSSITEVATKMGVSQQHAAHLLNKAVKMGLVRKIIRTEGAKHLYSHATVQDLLRARSEGKLGYTRARKPRQSKSYIMMQIPINNPSLADIIRKSLDNPALQEMVSQKIVEIFEPKLKELRELEEKQRKEKELLFKDLVDGSSIPIQFDL